MRTDDTKSGDANSAARREESIAAGTRLTMPEPAPEAADRIQSASPEGRPADSKVGPAGLWVMVLLGWLVIVAVGVLVGAWQGWAYGIAIIAFGTLVMTFNPVVLAQAGRAKERRDVILKDHENKPR